MGCAETVVYLTLVRFFISIIFDAAARLPALFGLLYVYMSSYCHWPPLSVPHCRYRYLDETCYL